MTVPVRAVERSLALLRCFNYETRELTLKELAERTGLSKSTALRLLETLESGKFVERDTVTGRYRLGIVCVELGMVGLEHMGIRRIALPRLSLLRDETQETVSLTVMEGGQVMYLDVLESPHPVKIAARPGRRLPLHCTATGKIFLAHMPREDAERVLSGELKRYTPNTVCDAALLREELQRIREQGFSTSEQQFELGISAVAAPIWDRDGKLAAVVGLAGPSYRISHQRLLEMGMAVRDTAIAISRQLGIPSEMIRAGGAQGVRREDA